MLGEPETYSPSLASGLWLLSQFLFNTTKFEAQIYLAKAFQACICSFDQNT